MYPIHPPYPIISSMSGWGWGNCWTNLWAQFLKSLWRRSLIDYYDKVRILCHDSWEMDLVLIFDPTCKYKRFYKWHTAVQISQQIIKNYDWKYCKSNFFKLSLW